MPGDKIQIGEATLTLVLAPDDAPRPGTAQAAQTASPPPSLSGDTAVAPSRGGSFDEDKRPAAPSGEMAIAPAEGQNGEARGPDTGLYEPPRALSTEDADLPVGPAAPVWRSTIAFLVDMAFGYIPAYLGILAASRGGFFNACGDASCFGPGGDHFILGVLPIILFCARAPIRIWTRLRRRRALAESQENDDGTQGDRFWATFLSWLGMALSVAGRSYIPAIAFVIARAGSSWGNLDQPSDILFSTLFAYVVPVWAGFLAVWEENGQTLGQTVAGLQVQTLSGRPAGFIRLSLRTAVFQVLGFLALWPPFCLVTYPLWRLCRKACRWVGNGGEVAARETEYRPWYDVLAGTRLRMRGFALASDPSEAPSGFVLPSFSAFSGFNSRRKLVWLLPLLPALVVLLVIWGVSLIPSS